MHLETNICYNHYVMRERQEDEKSWDLSKISRPGRFRRLLIFRPKRLRLQPQPSMDRQGPPNKGRGTAIGLMDRDNESRHFRPQSFLASLRRNRIIF